MFHSKSTNMFLLVFLFVFATLIAQPTFAKEEIRYTKFNIHTQTKDQKTFKASYANYTNPGKGHVIIPAGTEIVVVKKKRKGFTFNCDNGAKKVVYEFHKTRMAMSLDEYLDKISSVKPVSFEGLSEQDKKGVAEGKAYQGMSRKGVMIALGYPATHRTPSIDGKSWTYWTNRFGTIVVEFNGQGVVSEVRD